MHPFARRPSGTPRGVKPSLQLLLREGWRLAPGGHAFVNQEGKEVSLRGVLPARSRVVPTTPALADADQLSDEERYLARHAQVVLPTRTNPADYVDALRSLEAVEEVRLPPQIGLP